MSNSPFQPLWLDQEGPEQHVVLSTRIRLARNLQKVPFPGSTTPQRLSESLKIFEEHFHDQPDFSWLSHLVEYELLELQELHLVSQQFCFHSCPKALALNKEGSVSTMINEEDHLRIQVLLPGLQLFEGLHQAFKLDQSLEKKVDYAFHPQLGYLTSCPSNLGTGLRASLMLHLPGLASSNSIPSLITQVSQAGFTIRGLYGEGSVPGGDLFQLSNQITLGYSEEEILHQLQRIVQHILHHEEHSRQQLWNQYGWQFKDRITRSLGVLKTAHLVPLEEALSHLSMLRLGHRNHFFKNLSLQQLNQLLIRIRPASLCRFFQEEIPLPMHDLYRAQLLRLSLREVELMENSSLPKGKSPPETKED